MRLRNIYENKQDGLEEDCSACAMCDLECIEKIPCGIIYSNKASSTVQAFIEILKNAL